MVYIMIPLFKVFMAPDVGEQVNKTLYSGYIGQGPKVEEFEQALCNYINCKNLLTTNSCTSALQLALSIFQDEPEEVLTCPLTCFATTTSILTTRLKLNWVDVDPDTGNMCLDDLERKLNSQVKVVVPIHFAGYPIDLDRLKKIQNDFRSKHGYNFIILEDAAHAFGTKYKGKMIGSHGNYTCLSFQSVKTLTTGDGGALICPHQSVYSKAKKLRWYGLDRDKDRFKQDIEKAGYKYHMNDICATIGLSNLQSIDHILNKQKDNWYRYKEALPEVSFKYDTKGAEPNGYMYPIKVERLQDFKDYMEENGIETSPIHLRNDRYTCVDYIDSRCPNLNKLEKELTFIPCGWWLTIQEREHIITTIKKGW